MSDSMPVQDEPRPHVPGRGWAICACVCGLFILMTIGLPWKASHSGLRILSATYGWEFPESIICGVAGGLIAILLGRIAFRRKRAAKRPLAFAFLLGVSLLAAPMVLTVRTYRHGATIIERGGRFYHGWSIGFVVAVLCGFVVLLSVGMLIRATRRPKVRRRREVG